MLCSAKRLMRSKHFWEREREGEGEVERRDR